MADKKKGPTTYLVLIERETGSWQELGHVQSASAFAAKRAALAEYAPQGGTVVAVPVRSWEPEDLKPKLSFG